MQKDPPRFTNLGFNSKEAAVNLLAFLLDCAVGAASYRSCFCPVSCHLSCFAHGEGMGLLLNSTIPAAELL